MILRTKTAVESGAGASSDYWMTYSDLMANLLLVFALVLSVMMLLSQQKLMKQGAALKQKHDRLEKAYRQAEERLGIRKQIVEKIREKLKGKPYGVRVDGDTGALVISADVLFGQGEAEVTQEGQETLYDVMPPYAEALLGDEKLSGHVSRIIIEGHTNDDASPSADPYIYNLDLSLRRAFNVVRFLSEQFAGSLRAQQLRNYVVASGRSLVDLICKDGSRGECAPGQVDKVRSRRIEIKFSLKDDEMIRDFKRILAGSL